MRRYVTVFICFLYLSSTSAKNNHMSLLGTVKLGSKKLTTQLLCNGADPDQIDEFGNTALHYASYINGNSITDLLLSYHANPNIRNKKGQTPLHIATQMDNDYIIRRLLLYGANPNIQDANGNTALHLTASHPHREAAHNIAHNLLAHRADAQIKNNQGQTAYTILMQVKDAKCLSNRQKMNSNNLLATLNQAPRPMGPIHSLNKQYLHCAKTDNVKAMQKLAKYSTIEKNLQYGKQNRTALMYAARNNRTDMATYLINHLQVDKSIKDSNGKTAWHYAQKHNNSALNDLLLF